jgi:hypothetical protein
MSRTTPVPERAQPWLRRVTAALGLGDAEQQQCVAQAGLLLGGVPITWQAPLTGGDAQLAALAVIGAVGAPHEAGPTLEAVLHTQLLLCGPAMPVFGLDIETRSLVLQHVFDLDHHGAEQAATMLRAMQRIATDCRAMLPAVA